MNIKEQRRRRKPRLFCLRVHSRTHCYEMKTLRLGWRAVFFLGYTAKIVLEILLKSKLRRGFGIREAMSVRRRWARRVLHGIGVRLEVEGVPPDFPCLLVCNHRSYLDPLALLCHVDGYPVAKAEVRKYPFLGYGAELSGILFLKREHRGSRASTLKAIGETIWGGFPVILFPEGTTSSLPGTLEFKKSAFQIAAKNGFLVVPVAIHFDDPHDFWVGNVPLVRHARRSFQKAHIRVRLRYGPAMYAEDAAALAVESRQWIENQLFKMQNQPVANP